MSSGGLRGLASGLREVLPHAAIDLIRDAAPKGSNGFLLSIAAGPSVFDVVVSSPAQPHLGESNAVKHHIELTIAASIEAVTLGVSRPDWDWCAAVVHCKARRRL